MLNGYGHWVYLTDANGKIIGEMNDNGQVLGTVSMNEYVSSLGTVRVDWYGHKYLDRNWEITTQFPPTAPVNVRLYFNQWEWDSLHSQDPLLSTVGDLGITHYHGPNMNLDMYDNDYITGTTQFIPAPTWGTYTGSSTAGYWVSFAVTSFSEFFVGNSGGGPLPVSLVSFDVAKEGMNANVQWTTAVEENTDHFEVEVSSGDASHFELLGKVAAAGNSSAENHYNLMDLQLNKSGMRYYRLKMVDHIGTFKSSDVRALNFGLSGISVTNIYPNPTDNLINFTVNAATSDEVLITITNIFGQVMMEKSVSISKGISLLTDDVKDLAQGIYSLTLRNQSTGSEDRRRFEKF